MRLASLNFFRLQTFRPPRALWIGQWATRPHDKPSESPKVTPFFNAFAIAGAENLGFQVAFFAAAYFIVQRFTFTLEVEPLGRSPFFAPAALLLSVLIYTHPRRWLWFFIALTLLQVPLFAGNARFGIARGLATVPGFAITTGATAWWIQRHDSRTSFRDLKVFFGFLSCAFLIIPLFTILPIQLLLLQSHSVSEIWPTSRNSYLALATGVAIATPVFLAAFRAWPICIYRTTLRRITEWSCAVVALASIAIVTFNDSLPLVSLPFALYVPLTLLLWLGIRFGTAGAGWGLLLIAVIGSKSVASRSGPFGHGDPITDALHFQLFLTSLSIPMLVLSAYVETLTRTTESLLVSQSDLALKESALLLEHGRSHELAQHLITAQEQERTRIAAELHDNISQQLAAMTISLSTLKRRTADNSSQTFHIIEGLQKEASQLAEAIRFLSHDLHPATLHHTGFLEVVRSRCQEISRKTGLPIEVSCDTAVHELPETLTICLFRVIQEALHNTLKHADASSVKVKLTLQEDTIVLRVADNGRGFDRESPHIHRGLGLTTMRERAQMAAGTFSIESSVLGGTVVTVRVPTGVHHEKTSNLVS